MKLTKQTRGVFFSSSSQFFWLLFWGCECAH